MFWPAFLFLFLFLARGYVYHTRNIWAEGYNQCEGAIAGNMDSVFFRLDSGVFFGQAGYC